MMKGILKDYVSYCVACDEARKAHRKGSALWQVILLTSIYCGAYFGALINQRLEK